jgi:hypothetical protein
LTPQSLSSEAELRAIRQHATRSQAIIIDAVLEHGHQAKAAEALGIQAGSVSMAITRARRRAAARGVAPAEGVDHPQPEGQAVRGLSTLYKLDPSREDGAVLRWVKTTADREAQLDAIEEAIRELAASVRPAEPLPAPAYLDRDLLVVQAYGDPHFGMYADKRETRHADYDTRIASALHRGAADLLIQRTPAAGKCIITLIGDNTHADGMLWLTPRSRHVVDGDGRTWSVFTELVLALGAMADRALLHYGSVELVIIPGNHDPMLSHVLAITMEQRYRDEPRLEVASLRGSRFYFVTYGRNLLGFYHGDGKRAGIKDFGELTHGHPDWSRTKMRHGYTGHVHEARLLSGRGWTAESLATLAPPDSYSAGEGFSPPHCESASRYALADVYHVDGRRVSRQYVYPEEIAV